MVIGLLQQKIYYSCLAIFLVKDGRLQSHNGYKVFLPNNKKMHLRRDFDARTDLNSRSTYYPPILDPSHRFSLTEGCLTSISIVHIAY